MHKGKNWAALHGCLVIVISAGISTAVQASVIPLAAPGTYYFDGVCMDCLLDENQQPIPSPASATLTVREDRFFFDFTYHSVLWDLDTAWGYQNYGARMGPIDSVSGFADAFVRYVGYGYGSIAGTQYGGWELESFGVSGEWLLRGPTEYRTEDFGHTGTWRVASVPEPASLSLTCLGLAGVALLRRRKSILRES